MPSVHLAKSWCHIVNDLVLNAFQLGPACLMQLLTCFSKTLQALLFPGAMSYCVLATMASPILTSRINTKTVCRRRRRDGGKMIMYTCTDALYCMCLET